MGTVSSELIAVALFTVTTSVTLGWWIIKLSLGSELHKFRVELTRELDAMYVRRSECELKHGSSQDRLSTLESNKYR